jgi:hypothetical protein
VVTLEVRRCLWRLLCPTVELSVARVELRCWSVELAGGQCPSASRTFKHASSTFRHSSSTLAHQHRRHRKQDHWCRAILLPRVRSGSTWFLAKAEEVLPTVCPDDPRLLESPWSHRDSQPAFSSPQGMGLRRDVLRTHRRGRLARVSGSSVNHLVWPGFFAVCTSCTIPPRVSRERTKSATPPDSHTKPMIAVVDQ